MFQERIKCMHLQGLRYQGHLINFQSFVHVLDRLSIVTLNCCVGHSLCILIESDWAKIYTIIQGEIWAHQNIIDRKSDVPELQIAQTHICSDEEATLTVWEIRVECSQLVYIIAQSCGKLFLQLLSLSLSSNPIHYHVFVFSEHGLRHKRVLAVALRLDLWVPPECWLSVHTDQFWSASEVNVNICFEKRQLLSRGLLYNVYFSLVPEETPHAEQVLVLELAHHLQLCLDLGHAWPLSHLLLLVRQKQLVQL